MRMAKERDIPLSIILLILCVVCFVFYIHLLVVSTDSYSQDRAFAKRMGEW